MCLEKGEEKMDYVEFKEEIVLHVKDYLPEKYHNWNLRIESVHKVNQPLEALMLTPPGGTGGSPTLYLAKFYEKWQKGVSLESILQNIAEEFLYGMQTWDVMGAQLLLAQRKENVIYTLVHTKTNEGLLKEVPHREFLDLSVIYRCMIDLPGCGINSSVVTNALAEYMELSEEELYEIASQNTKQLMPLVVSGIPNMLYMLTNEKKVFGAATVLYPHVLERFAEGFASDFYLLPSSVHDMILMPDKGQKLCDLKDLLHEGNQKFIEENEFLSESVYVYRKEEQRLLIAQA